MLFGIFLRKWRFSQSRAELPRTCSFLSRKNTYRKNFHRTHQFSPPHRFNTDHNCVAFTSIVYHEHYQRHCEPNRGRATKHGISTRAHWTVVNPTLPTCRAHKLRGFMFRELFLPFWCCSCEGMGGSLKWSLQLAVHDTMLFLQFCTPTVQHSRQLW